MKSDRKYIVFFVLAFVALVLIEYYSPKPVDWTVTFSKKDKTPYGDWVIRDFLGDIFPGQSIKDARMPIYNSLNDTSPDFRNYIVVTDHFDVDTLNLKNLMNYVRRGNNVFIASEDFTGPIADTLKVKTLIDYILVYNSKDSVSLNFAQSAVRSPKDFRYKKGTVDYYFINYDTANTVVLGYNSRKETNFIRIKRGNGYFYLSSVPLAFTNYNALKGDNADYICRALSYMPVAGTLWDEYYKPNTAEADTPLRYILGNASLKRAYYLMMLGLLLYIVFEGKRKQRAIPVIKPLQNTSLEFTETVGLLYYQKGTNASIAKKKIQFFLDHLRSRYNMQTHAFDGDFCRVLSQKAAINEEEIRNLFTFITNVTNKEFVNEEALVTLSNLIEDFYQKTK